MLPPGAPVVLVVVDTLRADHLSVYDHPLETSPHLEAWSERGAVYDRAFASAPWTLPSVGSIFTGRYPLQHGSGRAKKLRPNGETRRIFVGLDESSPTLAEVLTKAGYNAGALVTNTFLRPIFGLTRGFESYDHARNAFLFERQADVMVERGLEWIDAQEEAPFFLFLHLLDPHMPYDPAPAVAGRFTADYEGSLKAPIRPKGGFIKKIKRRESNLDEADIEFLRGLYDEEIAFVDQQLGLLLEGLEERGILESGLVILTADHGEELLDHGSFEHGHSMYQEVLHIPLMVWGQSVMPGRRLDPVSLVDILPTVVDALGLPFSSPVDGISLWASLSRGKKLPKRALLAQNSLYGSQRQTLVEWPYKLIVNLEREQVLLFDLEKDPGETTNLSESHPKLRQRLFAAMPERGTLPMRGKEVDLDEETSEQLRALGYTP